MLNNYLLVAWRHILKNKLYSAINILGLVVGLSVYLFGSLLAEYERTHDAFFRNSERIFTVGSVFPNTELAGLISIDSVQSAVGPIIKTEIPEIEYISRSIRREFLLSIDDNDYYQNIRFVDHDFPRIFDFNYIEGDESALDSPSGLLITRSAATKYFGQGSAVGKSIELDHEKLLRVTAVVEDLPANSHFNSSLVLPAEFELVAHISVLNTEHANEELGNWGSLNLGDLTYLLVPGNVDTGWLQTRMDGIYDSHYPLPNRELVSGFEVNDLTDANTFLWSATGLPVIESIQLLALLVLIIAIVNYTNLATAQSLKRTREVGLRKTMGANQTQLLIQFQVESILIVIVSMIISIGFLELLIPLFNDSLGKGLVISYADNLLWLISTTLLVGMIAGAYPAYLITLANPIDALRDEVSKSAGGSLFRSAMLGIQFAISIFMLAIVLVVYLQNTEVEESGNIYPRSKIITLNRLELPDIRSNLEVLRDQVLSIPGVTGLGYSSQVPFQQSNSFIKVSAIAGDENNAIKPNTVWVSPGFFETYDIDILKGRPLTEDIANDTMREGVYDQNVVVNEMLLSDLGYTLDSMNPIFHRLTEEGTNHTYSIVGIVPDQNFLGFHNQIRPMVFLMAPEYYNIGSIKVEGRAMQATLADIEETWDRIIPDYPIQIEFLNEKFDDIFKILDGITRMLIGFAFVAMILSLVGLFGLAAFMVERRTREIGIRKIMGASMGQIMRLLIWQFSKPVLLASGIALPVAYLAADTYLEFFSNRLELPVISIIVAGIVGILLSWSVVSIHAIRVASENPIHALRYE